MSADVALTSQMSLFGGGPTVVAAASPILPSFTAAAPAEEDEEPVTASRLSAFERRTILRDKRHRLVGDLGRRDRRPHAEINAWLNQAVGVTRVEDATLEQLERSIGLLLDALAGKIASRR